MTWVIYVCPALQRTPCKAGFLRLDAVMITPDALFLTKKAISLHNKTKDV
jgi:hypothetical protein